MFNKETYIDRRKELKQLVGEGIIVLFGNNESPANYPANAYAPMRQDSTFLYYFGQHRDGLVPCGCAAGYVRELPFRRWRQCRQRRARR